MWSGERALNVNIFKKEETNSEFKKYLSQIKNHDILKKAFNQIKNFSQIENNLIYLNF